MASAGSSSSVRRPPAFLHASCCNSCAPPAGKRHGCAALVVPDSGAPGQPVEFYVSARHHQVSPSVGCCRRGDEDSGVLFGDTSSGPRQRKQKLGEVAADEVVVGMIEEQQFGFVAGAGNITSRKLTAGLPPCLMLQFLRPSRRREARLRRPGRPRRRGTRSTRCSSTTRSGITRSPTPWGAAGEETSRRRLDLSPRRPCRRSKRKTAAGEAHADGLDLLREGMGVEWGPVARAVA